MFTWSDISSESLDGLLSQVTRAYNQEDTVATETLEKKDAKHDEKPENIENKPMVYVDIFNPVLKETPPPTDPEKPVLTSEQEMYIQAVLEKSSSDNQFAMKAFNAIKVILSGGAPNPELQKKDAKKEDHQSATHATTKSMK